MIKDSINMGKRLLNKDISTISTNELCILDDLIKVELRIRDEARRTEALETLKSYIEDNDLSDEEVVSVLSGVSPKGMGNPIKKQPKSSSLQIPKYRHPTKLDLTWSRGRQAKWVVQECKDRDITIDYFMLDEQYLNPDHPKYQIFIAEINKQKLIKE